MKKIKEANVAEDVITTQLVPIGYQVAEIVQAEPEVTILKNIKIEEVQIDKIKPDPNQPRTTFDTGDLRGMAQSLLTTGIINPIEVDTNFVIVTGEMRWRAAKMAGWKTMPAKIIDITDEKRFMRQIIENLHHKTMSDWDTANGLKKLLSYRPGRQHDKAPLTGPTADQGIHWLAEKIGKSTDWVEDKFAILRMFPDMQEAIKEGKIPATFTRVIDNTPEKYKEAVKEKILSKELKTRDGALDLSSALKREEANPHIVKKLLDIDYSKYESSQEVREAVSKISPDDFKLFEQGYEPYKKIHNISQNLINWVSNNPIETVEEGSKIKREMESVRNSVRMWFRDADYLVNDTKNIGGKV